MMSPESVPSAMPPNEECGEDEEVWSGDSEDEQESNEVNTTGDGKEALENSENIVEEPKVGMTFDTSDDAFLYYKSYAKELGFAVAKRTSRKGKDVTIECNRAGKAMVRSKITTVKPRPQSKIGCQAHVTVVRHPDEKWRLHRVVLEHNHTTSPEKARLLNSYRVMDEHVKRKLDLNGLAGIKTRKTYDALRIEAGGPDKLPFTQKDCRNYVDKQRRLRLMEGDAEAMHRYFMKMSTDNSNFFYALDLNEKGRLRNVFWADARSRAACKEFGDVVTFDTTYLVNKYKMPFAPFVGVNHHGHSTLLGCRLISSEDTESFSWLFETWKTCMGGCAPKAIITDQCMAMTNAIQGTFPETRHRWCIWHIMRKLPEKLNGCKDYEKISWCMRKAVYDSLTIKEFEDAWDVFLKRYELQNNKWSNAMYLERKRWVPAFVKDVFWAGMSATQRSESMNAYFDGYVNSKTTLKEFVDQYENALATKVEIEKLEDTKSWSTYIPLVTDDEDALEKQFQSAYTNEKFKEFHKHFVKKLSCLFSLTKEGDIDFEYEVKEWVLFGEGEEKMRKQVPFTVSFNAETNEARCNCQLFEFRGMVCAHQLLVWHQRVILRVPDKYVLRRWSKNVKRLYSKVRISYDKSTSIEACRRDNIWNLFNELIDLAEDSQKKYDMAIEWGHELKRELIEASAISNGNVISLGEDPGTHNDSSFVGDGPFKERTNILDPECLRQKGRPIVKRKIGALEKSVEKKSATKKKPLSKKKSKENEDIAAGHDIGTQESVVNVNGHPSYIGNSMWPNMMTYNMAQGGSMFPLSPTLCPPGTSFNQFMPSLPSSQSLFNGQVWIGQPTIAGSQVWGGQSSILETKWQEQGPRGQQSFIGMMNAANNSEK